MRFKNIFSFVATLLSIVKRSLSGRDIIADFNDIEDRIQICRACEHRSADTLKDMECQLCECKVRYKVRLVSSECPEGRWISTDS